MGKRIIDKLQGTYIFRGIDKIDEVIQGMDKASLMIIYGGAMIISLFFLLNRDYPEEKKFQEEIKTQKNIENIFQKYDTNSNGFLDKDEIKEYLRIK